ncbi:MAG: hypothetical protein HYU69_17440 [Bacteroidetes bacterium]|nr:hypothetical protein [Bacteroidota bacterium]
MNKNESLFLLIRSLSKSEKRYFKLFAAKSGLREARQSVLLFDAIEKQVSKRNKKIKQYDESVVYNKLVNTPLAKQFSAAKLYLYNMILKSLHLFHEDVAEDVKERLHYIKILYNRNLHDQCFEVISKAKRIAKKYDFNELLLQLLDWEKLTIHNVQMQNGSLVEKTEKIIREEDLIIEKMARVRAYKNISFQFLSIPYKSDAFRRQETKALFEKLNRTGFVSGKSEGENFNEAFYRYKAYDFYYSRNEEHLNSYRFTKRIIQLMESNPDQIRFSPIRYIGSLNNHMLNCRRLGKYNELRIGIDVMRSFAATLNESHSYIHTLVFQSTYIFELKLYIDNGAFDKALGAIQVINDSIKKYDKRINELYKLFFYFNFSLVYFGLGDFRAALYWNNVEFNNPAIRLYDSHHRSLTILNLIVHYELRNFDLVSSIIRSLYRAASLKQQFNEYEVRLLDLFHALINMNLSSGDKKDIVTLFSDAKRDLLMIRKKNPFVTSDPPDFDITSWLNSKIAHRTFAEIVKEKSKKM